MRTITLLSLAVLGLAAWPLLADEPRGAAEFRRNRREIEKQLTSVNLNDRLAGLSELKKYPSLETVKIALPYWSQDPSPYVRSAAAEVLYAYKDEAALRPAFLATFRRELTESNGVLVAVWLAGAGPDEQREGLDLLYRLIHQRPAALATLFPVVDWLGTRQDAPAVKALAAFTELAAFKKQFGFRRCVVMALIGARHPDAMSKLLEILPEADGEIRGDIVQHLTRLSGQNLGDDAKAWLAWWNQHKANFQFPDPADKPGLMAPKGLPTYYGVAIHAKKVIFVLDTSGSMKGRKLVAAKKELLKTINELPATTSFNLVSFNSELEVWNRSLAAASPDTKKKAVRWVNLLDADGATFTYEALKATLDQQPEAIYLLTDGQPMGGSIVEPNAILEAIQQTNRYRRTTIHVIGVNPGAEEGVFSQFLKTLAAKNWGQYRRVD